MLEEAAIGIFTEDPTLPSPVFTASHVLLAEQAPRNYFTKEVIRVTMPTVPLGLYMRCCGAHWGCPLAPSDFLHLFQTNPVSRPSPHGPEFTAESSSPLSSRRLAEGVHHLPPQHLR